MKLTKSFFLNIPRTGSMWVKEALKRSCKVERDYKGHLAHEVYDQDLKNRRLFTFIRHPREWYPSYYYKMCVDGWGRPWEIKKDDTDGLRIFKDDDFNIFMDRVLTHKPRFYSEMVGQRLRLKPLIGRQENLVEDLIDILELCEEPFDLKTLRETPFKNVSENKPKYSLENETRLLEAEKDFINQFYSEDQWISAS